MTREHREHKYEIRKLRESDTGFRSGCPARTPGFRDIRSDHREQRTRPTEWRRAGLTNTVDTIEA
jgi:hypothetical protein